MKFLFSLCSAAVAVALTGVPAQAAAPSELLLTPASACKSPPSGPGKLLDRAWPNASTAGNAPFDHQVDINGDGWCDWVSTAAQPSHRDRVALAQPPMKDFIFLGSKSGWRRFGHPKAIRAYIDQHHFGQPGPYDGDAEVSAFVTPVFIYAKDDPRPYVAAISIGQDVLDAKADDVVIYRWNDGFDALLQVNEQERAVVLQFLRTQHCGKKASLPVQSVAEAVCAR